METGEGFITVMHNKKKKQKETKKRRRRGGGGGERTVEEGREGEEGRKGGLGSRSRERQKKENNADSIMLSLYRPRSAATHHDHVLHVLLVVASQLIHYNPLRKLHLRTWNEETKQNISSQLILPLPYQHGSSYTAKTEGLL